MMYMYTDAEHIPLSIGSHDNSTIRTQIIMYWWELLHEVGIYIHIIMCDSILQTIDLLW